jgi:DNA helicase HerA-like ATPase
MAVAMGQTTVAEHFQIGIIEGVSAGSAIIRFDRSALEALRSNADSGLAMAGAVGSHLKIKVGSAWLLGSIRSTRLDASRADAILGEIELVGEGGSNSAGHLDDFQRGITAYPRAGDAVMAAGWQDLRAIFGGTADAHVDIGTVYPFGDVRASLLTNPLLSRHFALLGSTGSGKSTATALILHRIIQQAPEGHVVIIDPHGEYAQAFADNGQIFNVDNLDMPYWMLNFEEHSEVFVVSEGVEAELDKAILAKCLLQARRKSLIADQFPDLTVDSPVPYMIFELQAALQGHMGRLDHSNEIARYQRLKNRIDEILRDTRYAFMFRRDLSNDSMKDFLGRILRMPGNGRPVSVIDLSGVPGDIVNAVVALLSRIVMDYAIWARTERPHPILLVCEEAHRYVPAESNRNGKAVRKVLERIAKEGRKYGVSLALISQRPSDLAEGALSQCGTIIAMRLSNERDQACVRNAMPEGGRGLLDAIPALRKGECVISGEGVTVPMRVRIDRLEEALRPRSDDPAFSTFWNTPDHDDAALDRVILRWRRRSGHLDDQAPAPEHMPQPPVEPAVRPSLLLKPEFSQALPPTATPTPEPAPAEPAAAPAEASGRLSSLLRRVVSGD